MFTVNDADSYDVKVNLEDGTEYNYDMKDFEFRGHTRALEDWYNS